jgi:hypothetical protein
MALSRGHSIDFGPPTTSTGTSHFEALEVTKVTHQGKAVVALLPQEEKDKVSCVRLRQPLQIIPYFLRLKLKLPWWQEHATKRVQRLILTGVEPFWVKPPTLPIHPTFRDKEMTAAALLIMEEYREVGAVIPVPAQDLPATKYLVPWFIITKKRGGSYKVQTDSGLQINKSAYPYKTFFSRPLADNFSISFQGHVGMQNRFEACLLSSQGFRDTKTLPENPGRRTSLPVFGCPI